MRAIRRGVVRSVAALLLAAAVVALPAALVAFAGWPLPHHVPTSDEVSRWLTSPLADDVVLDLLAIAAWLLWAAFLPAVAAEALAARRGLPTAASTRRTGNPLRVAAATLITAITLGTLTAAGIAGTAVGATPVATAPVSASNPTGDRAEIAGQLVAWPVPGSRAAPARGAATFVIGQSTYTHVVARGDTLSGIARDWLGDATRWPQICTLNWHRHWPEVGGRLTDCDLIYPGWTLRLPDDATPPAGASPTAPGGQPTAGSSPAGQTDAGASPQPRERAGTATTEPTEEASRPATTAPTTSSAASPLTTEAPAGSPAAPATTSAPSPGGTAFTVTASPGPAASSGHAAPDPDSTPAAESQDGVTLPGGFVPWSLASSIAAAVALVWLQRRRRHRPGQADDDPTDLPPPVHHLHRAVLRRAAQLPSPSAGPVAGPARGQTNGQDLAERAANVPDQAAFPPGGVGLVGDGGHAAARAALAAVLSSGGPRNPDRRGEAVIDGTTLTTLIGADAAALGPWPRLHVADHVEHALAVVEEMLMHRARIMDDHAVTDLDTLRDQAPDEEPLPPVLLITDSPAAGIRMRMKTALALGQDVQVTALLLGTWDHGVTVHVDADGHTRPPSPDDDLLPATVPDRVGVLDTDTAVAVLATLREAHTGQRPAIHLTTTAPTAPDARPVPPPLSDSAGEAPPTQEEDMRTAAQPVSAQAGDAVEPDDAAADGSATSAEGDSADGGRTSSSATGDEPEAKEPAGKARLRVLGSSEVLDVVEPGKPLRAKALELAVFLACHPDGADARGLGEHLEPGVRLRNADVRMHTNVSNLRHVFGRAAGPRKMGYIVKATGRYRLDPTAVDADLWTFRTLLAQAALAPGEQRLDLLRQACALYQAPLGEGCDYEWIEPHREKIRQEASAAHLLLAGELLTSDPQEAADLLDKAIRLDTYNEELYRLAMRARRALGDREGIRHLLQALTVALADLDAEPEESTVELAAQLRSMLPAKGRPDVRE